MISTNLDMAGWRSRSRLFVLACERVPLLVLAVVLVANMPGRAVARGVSVYTISKVRLDVSAENAVAAKKQALEEGPLQALKLIFKRFAPFRAYDRLPDFTAEEADSVIDGFAVRSERNSPTRYIALLDFNFSRQKLQALLVQKGVPFVDRRSGKQVLMPVFSAGLDENGEPANQDNRKHWSRAWRGIDFKHALTDTRLYQAKNSDQVIWNKIAAGEFEAFEQLRQQYAAPKLILADAVLNESKDKLTLRLYGEDYHGQFDYSQEMPVEHSLRKSYEIAAKVAFGIVEGRWREPRITGNVISVSTGADDKGEPGKNARAAGRRMVLETVFLRVSFRGLRDWQQIKKRLALIPGVQKMRVNSLSPRGADVRLHYPGGRSRLQGQLSSYGFALDRNGKDQILRSIR